MSPNIVTRLSENNGQIVNQFGNPIDVDARLNSGNPIKPTVDTPKVPRGDVKRYNKAVNKVQKQLGLDERQAQGFLKKELNGATSINAEDYSNIDNIIGKAKDLRAERSGKVDNQIKDMYRYDAMKEQVQDKLGISSEKAESYMKNNNYSINKDDAKMLNERISADEAIRQARQNNQPLNRFEDTSPKAHNARVEEMKKNRMIKEAHAEDKLRTARKPYEGLTADDVREEAFLENRSRTFKDRVNAIGKNGNMTPETKSILLGRTDPGNVDLPPDPKQEKYFANKLDDLKSGRKYNAPPTQSSIRQKAVQEATEELTNNAGKVAGKNADDVAKQVSKFGKIGRIAAGLGVGAMVVSNMNKNKGQQTNGQLYGQQTPYGY